jgi:hypothetical protein
MLRFVYAKQVNVSEDGEKTQTMLECHGPVDSRLRLKMSNAGGRTNTTLNKSMKQTAKTSK